MRSRIFVIFGLLFLSLNSFSETYFVKYLDLTTEKINTEIIKNNEEFKNRLSELKYLNNDSLNVIEVKKISGKNQIYFKMSGEGAGN